MHIAIAAAILIIMAIALARALLGPTLFDRILAINTFGTKTVLLVTVLGVFTDNASYLDIALVYALINFIGVIAVLRFLEYGREQQEKATKRGRKKA